jgi:ParB-like nuclease domain
MPDQHSAEPRAGTEPRLVTVALGDVKPNPYRDLPHYELDEPKIRALMASIGSTGFWANVIGRVNSAGAVEIAYGHHRVEAARRVLGSDHRHTFPVYPISDAVMIRMMADENSDAWSNQVRHGNLVVGVARDYLDNLFDQYETLDNLSRVPEFWNTAELFGNEGAYQQVRRDGVGETIIARFLGGTFAKGQDVENALAHLPLSPKQRAAKQREEAEARLRAAEIKAEKERQRIERDAEEQIARAAAEHARAEREAAEAERKRLAEETRRTNAWLKKMRDNEARAQAAADAAASKRIEADRKAAEQAQKLAEEAEARAEARRKEAEEAEARLLAEQEAEAKARKQRQEEIRAEIERLEKKEAQITARLAQDGLYDVRAGELFARPMHARAFREVVTSERAVAAGIRVEDQYRLAQEIIARYTARDHDRSGNHVGPDDALTARTIKQHIMRLVLEAEGIAWNYKERREKLETTFVRLNKGLLDAASFMCQIIDHFNALEIDTVSGLPVAVFANNLDVFDSARAQLAQALKGRAAKQPAAPLTLIPSRKEP